MWAGYFQSRVPNFKSVSRSAVLICSHGYCKFTAIWMEMCGAPPWDSRITAKTCEMCCNNQPIKRETSENETGDTE